MTLKELRLQAGKTVAEVAEAMGMSAHQLYNYEQGIRTLNIDYIIPMAALYDVTERELIEAQIESKAAK